MKRKLFFTGSKEVYFYKFKVNNKTFILESRQLNRAMTIQQSLALLETKA